VQKTSWATPAANQANGEPEAFLERKRRSVARGSQMGVSLTDLQMQAKLASWPTPVISDGCGTRKADGKRCVGLNSQAAWTTPNARDFKSENVSAEKRAERLAQARGKPLSKQSHGMTLSGSPAQTESKGQLNPAFSLWLMGYPAEWLSCAPQGTQSSRKSQQSSSKRVSDE
jgi:hypothetical protein